MITPIIDSVGDEQAKEMFFPELIPQKGNEAMLPTVPHEGGTLHCKRRPGDAEDHDSQCGPQ